MSAQDPLDWLGRAPAFAQAVQALEAASGRRGGTGRANSPEAEPILFRSTPTLAFAPADVTGLRRAAPPFAFEVEIAFLGLYGPASPLPPLWTERIARQEPGWANLRDLLDLFGHPMAGLLWRAFREARPHLAWSGDGRDAPSRAALSLGGVSPGVAGGALPRTALLPLAGRLAQHAKGAGEAAACIAAVLGVGARIEEWVRRRARLPAEEQPRLGAAALGEAVLGEAVPDVAGTARLILGPMGLRNFLALLPGGAARPALSELLRLLVNQPLRMEVELRLAAGESAGTTLGATRLGYTSWLGDPGRERACPTGPA